MFYIAPQKVKVGLGRISSDGDILRLVVNQNHEVIECHAHGLPAPTQLRWVVNFTESPHNQWQSFNRGKKFVTDDGIVDCNSHPSCQIRPKRKLKANDIITCSAQNTVPTEVGWVKAEDSISIQIKIVGKKMHSLVNFTYCVAN